MKLCFLAYPLEGLHTSHSLVVDVIGPFVVFTFVELILHYNVCRMKEPFLNPIGIVANLQHGVEHFQELHEVWVIQVIDDVSHVHQVQLGVAYPWLPLLDGLGVQEEAFLGLRIKFKELFIELFDPFNGFWLHLNYLNQLELPQ